MSIDTMIGVDLAKSVFQVHGASMNGEMQYQRKLSRQAFRTFMAQQPAAAVVMEAYGSAHYWARVLSGLGHEVRLIAPRYVRPFVKRQKNDAADAEAIVVAAQRAEMRCVEPKSETQQSAAILYRSRQRLVRQRTETVNALRAALYEFGHVIPQGIQHVGRIRAILEVPNSDLPTLMRGECLAMLDQIAVLNGWIDTKTAKIKELAATTPVSKRLQTMPGVGPLVALAVETFAPDMASFRKAGILRLGLGWCRDSFHQAVRNGSGGSPRPAKQTSGRC
jgi:transposase